MVDEAEMLDAVRERLSELLNRPVEAESHPPEGADAVFQTSNFRFLVEVKSSARLASIHQACEHAKDYAKRLGPKVVPLVAVPHMGPSGREACKAAGVGFVDMSGNAHIEAPGLLVHVDGKRDGMRARGRPLSAFAPKSSRVTRVLLLDPERWRRQRELVEQTRLGRGFVSRIVSRLANDGLIELGERAQCRPRNPDLLLDAWRDDYDFFQHQIIAGHIPARSGEDLVGRLISTAKEHRVEYALTGLPAAAKLAPFAGFRLVAAYLRRSPKQGFLASMGFHPGDQGANTWLVIPADEGVFEGSKEVSGQVCVSAVQTYLDLQHMPERASEAAEQLRKVCLNWQ